MSARPLPLLVLLALPGTAAAVDLDLLVEAWTYAHSGVGAEDGDDECRDLMLDISGDVIAAGWLDGDVGEQDGGYIVRLDPTMAVVWEHTHEQGPISGTKPWSDDRYYGLDMDPVDGELLVCGVESRETEEGWYLVQRLDLYGNEVWTSTVRDGANLQECRDVQLEQASVRSAGFSDRATQAGRWISYSYDVSDDIVTGVLNYDFLAMPSVPDQAYGVATDALDNFAIVGQRGLSGTDASLLNDIDWHVRFYDSAGAAVWEDTHEGSQELEDVARDVIIDSLNGNMYVVGWENAGNDNAAQADLDWLIIAYDRDGYGGGPDILWTATWESAPGASEGATAVTLDEVGDVLVGGWAIDPGTGQEVWRVAKHAAYDGVLIQEWWGAPQGGDSRLHSLDHDGDRLAMGGYVHNGTDTDFAVLMLEDDRDEDGVADSVDICPDDGMKWDDPGVCGCDKVDVDSDGDGTMDCVDTCPTNPDKVDPGVCGCEEPDDDSDGDGTEDCDDKCPDDPDKIEWGECGCGAPDNDTDADGVLGCHDACPNTPPGEPVDQFGCPQSADTGDTGDTTDPTDGSSSGGCGCTSGATPAGPAGLLALLGVLALGSRRRR